MMRNRTIAIWVWIFLAAAGLYFDAKGQAPKAPTGAPSRTPWPAPPREALYRKQADWEKSQWEKGSPNTEVVEFVPRLLSGKELTVRIYRKADSASGAYETVKVDAAKCSVTDRDPQNAVAIVVGSDQPDPDIARMLQNTVLLLSATDNWMHWHYTVSRTPILLADARGKPIPAKGLKLTLLLNSSRNFDEPPPMDDVWRVSLDKLPAGDAQGNFAIPELEIHSAGLAGCLYSHPDYGTAFCQGPVSYLGRLPLVRRGSPEAERALTGQVVGPGGSPVPNAFIQALGVSFENRTLFQANRYTSAVSDAEGRFSFYPVEEKMPFNVTGYGTLILANSTYDLEVKPTHPGLFPTMGEFSNAQPAQVVLDGGDAFHQFAFETDKGRMTAQQTSNIAMRLQKPANRMPITIPKSLIRDGGKIPFGIYEAHDQNTGKGFNPVTVDEKSPREIVFTSVKPVENSGTATEYHGCVVDGSTDKPLAGAFVIGTMGPTASHHLSELTPEQWRLLHTATARPDFGDKPMEPLRQIYSSATITRTAADGTWSLTMPEGSPYLSIDFAEQDYFIFGFGVRFPAPNAQARPLPAKISLNPAAHVKITPTVAAEHLPKLGVLMLGLQATWVGVIQGKSRNVGGNVGNSLNNPNVETTIDVPAGVPLNLRFISHYNERFGDIVIPGELLLKKGETRDLGSIEVPYYSHLAAVHVVDEAGKPVPGMQLAMISGMMFRGGHMTDDHGVALFYMPVGEKIAIGIRDYDQVTRKMGEYTVPVEVTGKETQTPIFTLKLTHDVIERKKNFPPRGGMPPGGRMQGGRMSPPMGMRGGSGMPSMGSMEPGQERMMPEMPPGAGTPTGGRMPAGTGMPPSAGMRPMTGTGISTSSEPINTDIFK